MGDGDKTLVFLHGWGGSTDSFLGVARQLSNKYKCILVDFAGFGKTPEPKTPYKLRNYTKDLDSLLDKLYIKRCFFIAHSFGGRVALDYMSINPNRIEGLVLADIAGLKPRRGVKYYFNIVKYKIYRRIGLDTSKMGSKDYRVLSPIMKRTFTNIVNEYLNKSINNIHIPTLLVWGEYDKDTPMYMARKLKRKIKGSELIVFKGRGHFAYLEENYKFMLIVDAFVGG